jgi:hypothetical protein
MGLRADHEGTGGGPGSVILRQDRPARRGIAGEVEQRCAGQVAIVGMRRRADALDDGRETIDQ